MNKDIALGQYYPGTSILHKADARMKIIIMILFLTVALVADSSYSFLFCGVLTLGLIAISDISLRIILKNLKTIIFVLLFTTALNIFFVKGDHLLFRLGVISVYREGVIYAVYMIIRLVSIICGSFIIVSYTTSPTDLTDAIEWLLSPLKVFKVPVHDFAMMMMIALRFIPSLMEETQKIISAQKSRGADFESGGLIKRAKALIPILVPLFASSFRHAEELASAMECRCYRSGVGKTRMKQMRFRVTDYILLAVFVLFVLVTLLLLNRYEIMQTVNAVRELL